MSANGKSRGVAIIGLGGCLPGASNVPDFWKNICEGVVAIREVPPERWDASLYFSSDRSAPDKTYSKIGGFLSAVPFDAKRFRIPPKTLQSVDDLQKLALTVVAEALEDAGYQVFGDSTEGKPFNRSRMAVILGNAMGGEAEDLTSLRVWFAEARRCVAQHPSVRSMPQAQQQAFLDEIEASYKERLPRVTEDSMPGELSNCITGRVANAFDLQGANFTTDAACAASMAALQSAVHGLLSHEYDLAIAGGADRSMDPPTYVKFSKIGALAADISAPFDARANGFVMGEGVGVLLLKRVEDAERDGDRIYAVIKAVGAASDGKGKGMTAPNPRGQKCALERAYAQAGFSPSTVGLFEAHGTSTTVGDATELKVITEVLKEQGSSPSGVPIGSVKSMIGHLKSAAGAASLIKTALALHHKIWPPSANFQSPPAGSPLEEGYVAVNTRARAWEHKASYPRRAGVSAFGFGGANFHVVLEEYMPHQEEQKTPVPVSVAKASVPALGAADVLKQITALFAEKTGYEAADLSPDHQLESDLGIDTVKQAELLALIRTQYGLPKDDAFKLTDVPTLNHIAAYVARMVSGVAAAAPVVEEVKEETLKETQAQVCVFGGADTASALRGGQELLSKVQTLDASALKAGREQAIQASARVAFVAQTVEEAHTKLSEAGKRRAKILVAQGIFVNEGEPLSKQGRVAFLFPGQGSQYVGMMRDLAQEYPVVADTFKEADELLKPLIQCTLTDIVWAQPASEEDAKKAELLLRETQYCQPAMLAADVAMMRLLMAHGVRPHMVVGHSLGEYAACVAAGVLSFADALYAVSARGREMAGVKVQDNGKMAMVAADAQRVAQVLKSVSGYVIAANKNCHTQTVIAGNSASVEEAVKTFAQLGMEAREIPVSHAFHSAIVAPATEPLARVLRNLKVCVPSTPILSNVDAHYYPTNSADIVDLLAKQLASPVEFIDQVERMYQDGARIFIEVGPKRAITGFVRNILGDREHRALATNHHKKTGAEAFKEVLAALASDGVKVNFEGKGSSDVPPGGQGPQGGGAKPKALSQSQHVSGAVVVSGMAVLPPSNRPLVDVHEDAFADVVHGCNYIGPLSAEEKQSVLDKNITRLNKTGGGFELLRDVSEVVKLAARIGEVDLVAQYGLEESFVDALDATGRLAIAVGIDALRDAGLPLVRRYRTTSTGKQLPDRWVLPSHLARTTGVILASAFPGIDRVIDDVSRHTAALYAHKGVQAIEQVYQTLAHKLPASEAALLMEACKREGEKLTQEAGLYTFNRKFLFRVLSLGHAQLAQVILAQGPNTQVNAACASGTQAIGIAQDWIRTGRCERVLVVTADDVTHKDNLPWIAAGFLASGAATVEGDIGQAAVPFGAERNGMILGAGASAFVLEREDCVQARGLEPLAEVLSTRFVNSAFHGTRLDSEFIRETLNSVVQEVCEQEQCTRQTLAQKAFFMSHETYTPARGGSSAAEVDAIRHAFGDAVSDVLVANTKGYTGHPMGASIEDVVAIKGLQRQQLPAIANMHTPDPDFKDLRFAKGGAVSAEYAIRFGAGFGSQIAVAVYKRRASSEARLKDAQAYAQWITQHTGKENAGMEVVNRALRVAESGGVAVEQLGIPSLKLASEAARTPVVQVLSQVAQPVVSTAFSRSEVLQKITQLFAEHTGYSPDELDPSHQLESDLGIDTVKQAEIFSHLRNAYQLPREESFRLSDVPTLNAIVDYVMQKTAPSSVSAVPVAVVQQPVVMQEVPKATVQAPVAKAVADAGALLQEITVLFAEQTGYEPTDLDPSHQLEADLGIDTVKQAEIFSKLRERYGLPKDDAFKLSDVPTLNAVVAYVSGFMGAAPAVASSGVPETQPAPVVPAVSSVAKAPSSASLLEEITVLFAEQTGYEPTDLDPSHQLEADLGIDTVKQAEIFSKLRERYGLPKDDAFKLSDVPTLNAVVAYVSSQHVQKSPQAGGSVSVKKSEQGGKAGAVQSEGPFCVDKVRVSECALPTLGDARVLQGRCAVLVAEDPAMASAVRAHLVQRGMQVHTVAYEDARNVAVFEQRLKDLAGKPADDLVWCVNADESVLNPHVVEQKVGDVFHAARCFARARMLSQVGMSDAGFLVLGRGQGLFGARGCSTHDGVMAGASGVVKSVSKEWQGAHCCVVDVDTSLSHEDAVCVALDAWVRPMPVELAYVQGAYVTFKRGEAVQGMLGVLPDNAAVLATGGTRGVTYSIVHALAQRKPLRVVLVGRTESVAKQDSVLFNRSEAEQKELAKAALAAQNERVTPAAVKKWIAREESKIEIHENIEALKRAGASVELMVCHVDDPRSLQQLIERVRAAYGHVDLLIHGAGSEESKFIADKDEEAFVRVYRGKASSALALWLGLKPKRMLTMGSVAGRFGNAGQADYAAANEVMASLARFEDNHVLNVCWTAWGDVGMAVRGSIKTVLEASGVDLLPASLGASLGAQLCDSDVCGDVVVAGRLGAFDAAQGFHFDTQEVLEDGSVVFMRKADPHKDTGLSDHRIEGVPVLPGVLGFECMVQAASRVLGCAVGRASGVKFSSPLKFFKDAPLDVCVQVYPQDAWSVRAVLFSHFVGPGQRVMRKEHFTAVLHAHTASDKPCASPAPLGMLHTPGVDKTAIYQRYFHGPLFQVLSHVYRMGDDAVMGDMVLERPSWLTGLSASECSTKPYEREAGFQTAGLWEMAALGRMALPSSVEEVVLGKPVPVGVHVHVEARMRSHDAQGAVFDVWLLGDDGVVYDTMLGYRTVVLRDLREDERIVSGNTTTKLPASWLVLPIAEAEALIGHSMEAAAKRYLAPSEQVRLATLSIAKRRLEWFSVRLAVKRLIRETCFAREGVWIPYTSIVIHRDELGAPAVEIEGRDVGVLRVSMSHSAGVAAAFISTDASCLPGLDVERVEKREPSFAQNYFTAQEQTHVAHDAQPEVLLTSMWAVKESVLKALGVGARVDFRDVEVTRAGGFWKADLKGEALQRAEALGVVMQEAQVHVETYGHWVMARVLLPSRGVVLGAALSKLREVVVS